MTAPHLPPKKKYLQRELKMQSLPWLLLIVGISMLSSIAASLITVVWLAPTVVSQEIIFSLNNKKYTKAGIDSTLVNQARQRVMTLYDASKKINLSFYDTDALVGEAALLSSDGWSVAYVPNGNVLPTVHLEGVDVQGIVHKIERTVYDSVSSLLYIKFSGSGYRIMPLSVNGVLTRDSVLWNLSQDSWQSVATDGSFVEQGGSTYALWSPHFFFKLTTAGVAKSIIINDQGEMVGFATENNSLLPSWIIANQLGTVLESGSFKYVGLPIDGHFVSGSIANTIKKKIAAWYVTGVGKVYAASIKKGDTIVAINHTDIDPPAVARLMVALARENAIVLTIIRDGKTIDVTVKEQVVSTEGLTKR